MALAAPRREKPRKRLARQRPLPLGGDGNEAFTANFGPSERERLDRALDFSRRVLDAAGAKRVLWTDFIATHTQGTVRMGDDPTLSAVARHGESHDVRGLFVGDASLVPCTRSVNPSLTVMALAARLALHLDERLSAA